MRITVCPNEQAMGLAAAQQIAATLRAAVEKKGVANLLVSTGASQFTTLAALVQEDVPWRQVTMFHLDEYVNLPESHIASFRRYLKERLTTLVPFQEVFLIDGEGDVERHIREVSEAIGAHPIDVGVIGVGENGHIAFNDPPADFETSDAYHLVTLDEACKRQQVGEGWFETIEDVPSQAVSITPRQIMRCGVIVSAVPSKRKAAAVAAMLAAPSPDPQIPASLLKTHADFHLYLDEESASMASSIISMHKKDSPFHHA